MVDVYVCDQENNIKPKVIGTQNTVEGAVKDAIVGALNGSSSRIDLTDRMARAAIKAHVAALAQAGFAIVWRNPAEGEKVPAKRASAGTRGTRMTPDWTPKQNTLQFLQDLGLDPSAVLAEFLDYWVGVPGQRGTKLDWDATLRNQGRHAAERANRLAGQREGGNVYGFTRSPGEREKQGQSRADQAVADLARAAVVRSMAGD